jgi:hypothetical protein
LLDVLNKLRRLLTQISDGKGDPQAAAKSALDLLPLLGEIDSGATLKVSRGGADVEYVVEKAANGETLAERRKTGKAQPFRCPKAIHDALVEALAATDRALPLDEIVAAVGERFGDEPPDFQVRVPLRLWMQVEPPLVVRNRARYRPVDQDTFASATGSLWTSLRRG